MISISVFPPACRYALLIVLAMFLLGGAAQAQSSQSDSKTLIDAWLGFPDVADVDWPYAYIRAKGTTETGGGARQDLLAEYKQLLWRLDHDGYEALASAVRAWRTRIKRISVFRTPGNWAPSFLMSHINSEPPLGDVNAIGACQVPTSVTVWSSSGVAQVPWQSDMRLSDIEARVPALRKGSAAEIAVVDTYGDIDHYGVQAWNYADGEVAPGTQIISTLPLKGDVFVWMRDAMARLLAHSPTGTNCHEVTVHQESRGG